MCSSLFPTRDDVQVLFSTFITTVIVAYMAYTRVVCASMHVLFPVQKFLLCAIAFAPGKLRVVLKIANQSRAGSHFNSQNTHSQFRNSQLAFYPYSHNKHKTALWLRSKCNSHHPTHLYAYNAILKSAYSASSRL